MALDLLAIYRRYKELIPAMVAIFIALLIAIFA